MRISADRSRKVYGGMWRWVCNCVRGRADHRVESTGEIDEGRAAGKRPHEKIGYFLSISQPQQAVFAEVIPNSAAEIFSLKHRNKDPQQLG